MSAPTVPARIPWIDAARGIALALVVFLHAELRQDYHWDSPWQLSLFNDGLDTFRMPLLFALSGLLTVPVLERTWASILRRRVLPLLYLVAAWTLVLVAFFSAVRAPAPWSRLASWDVLSGDPYGPTQYVFSLALFVVLHRALRRVPAWALAAAAVAVHLVVNEFVHGPSAWGHIAQNWVYFALALAAAPVLLRLGQMANAGVAAVAVLGFGALALVTARSGLLEVPAIHLGTSVVGIVVGVLLAAAMQDSWIGRPFVAIGKASLAVFLVHRALLALVFMAALAVALAGSGPLFTYTFAAGAAVIALFVGTLLGKWVTVPGVFRPPWSVAPRPGEVPSDSQRSVAPGGIG